jgi:predicted hotdog family 3-hydroxylacyl-ACP dehydratase
MLMPLLLVLGGGAVLSWLLAGSLVRSAARASLLAAYVVMVPLRAVPPHPGTVVQRAARAELVDAVRGVPKGSARSDGCDTVLAPWDAGAHLMYYVVSRSVRTVTRASRSRPGTSTPPAVDDPQQNMGADLEVAATSPFFAGHFPDDPMLPGAALLQLVLQRLPAFASDAVKTVAFSRVRFLQPQRPGARLRLAVQALADNHVQVTVTDHSGNTVATIGLALRAHDASTPVGAAAFGSGPTPMAALPELPPAVSLPHTGPARLLTAQLAGDAHALAAAARVPATSPFAAGPWGSVAWIEAAAQAAAAHGALRAARGPTASATRGFLVGLKHMHLARESPLARECRVEVQRLGGNGALAIYAARVIDVDAEIPDAEIMGGELSVWTRTGARSE